MSDSAAAAARLLELLWSREEAAARTGALTRTRIVDAALAIADEHGLEAVSMRHVGSALGVAAMSLYTHVPDKQALLALMTDRVLIRMAVTEPTTATGWRDRLRLVADDNRALLLAHPWLLETPLRRPDLGPGLMAKYEWELAAFHGMGMSALERDAALRLLLEFVRSAVADEISARRAAEERRAAGDAWWETVGPVLDRHVHEADFPLAVRIGAQAGAVLGDRYDADHAYAFGLERLLDGIGALVARQPGRRG